MPRERPASPATAALLLPARAAFAGRELPADVSRALGRADFAEREPGARAQLQRHFDWLPRGWPVAALTRAIDAPDADGSRWLRADPAWIQPDINGARLFASGEGLRLSREDADALLPALRPLFGDSGMPIDAPDPSRWYLRVQPGVPLPEFQDPADALGADLGDALVGAADDAGQRRWRTLLTEAQVVLHHHPWNARRVAQGKPPVNSLWFWGGGALPTRVDAPVVCSDDVLLRGLASRAGRPHAPLPARFDARPGDLLWDLRAMRDPETLLDAWLRPALQAVGEGTLARLRLDFADGAAFAVLPSQRRRFWRRPRRRLVP